MLDRRRAGVLLHLASLPGKQRLGNLGVEAQNFIHFMVDSGLSVWQMLPLGPTHADGSPYQCLSAHAGNPEFIDVDALLAEGWLHESEVVNPAKSDTIQPLIDLASERFFAQANADWISQFNIFRKQHAYWLSDYALFMALKKAHQNRPWTDWHTPLKQRDPSALTQARQQHEDVIRQVEFTQFIFFHQWHALRDYANRHGVKLFGDMPIYVSMDSAEVWAERENFLIDEDGHCDVVAGVPPDAFSEQGQRWGNPLYDWSYQQQQDFKWWVARFKTQLELFDFIRLDHFRGLQACWHIPASAQTAIDGHWEKSPGEALLRCLKLYFHALPLIAEDLGLITPEVHALREQFDLPGMAILQFAFDGDNDNLYLPHNHSPNSVVYTGTHDNDTTLGWYQNLDARAKAQLKSYLGVNRQHSLDMPWVMNRMALASVARLAMLPMQDLLSLDSMHRMNTPGTCVGNWQWRFEWSQLWPTLPGDLKKMVALYGRSNPAD